jgi:hypothetical protein
MAIASDEFLQMLVLPLAPLGSGTPARSSITLGNISEGPTYAQCHPECQFPQITPLGDKCGFVAPRGRKKSADPETRTRFIFLVSKWRSLMSRNGLKPPTIFRPLRFQYLQSGISGSSPQMADPALLAVADPARFAVEKGEPTPALSVDRYTSRSPVMVPTYRPSVP